jgi:NodT family efflux transporter outer membrane factor (OMF) lipoprotein
VEFLDRHHRLSRRTTCGAVAYAVLPLFVAGCGLGEWARNGGKVGPNYKAPRVAVAETWLDYQDPRLRSEEADLGRWWSAFQDPVLDSLIQEAFQQNLSLRVAGERIAESRARRGIAVGNLFPQQQELAGSATANKASTEVANAGTEQWFRNTEVGFNVAWELDLWGRFRRAVEAADAELDASVANFDDVQYRTFQERIAVARRNVEIQEASYQLADDKFKAGNATERDAQQARQILEQTRALIPQLEIGRRHASNALCVLLGIPPVDLTERLAGEGTIPSAPPEVAVGIPADLLRRRPDVRRLERQTAAQSALIGVTKADLYPRLSLLGSIGVRAEDFGDLFDTPGSLSGFVGPSVQWDIFNYGRIGSNVQAQEARFRQFVYSYQEAVLRAGREAEDAAVSFLKSQERARYLTESVAAASRTVEITRDQYKDGAIDFTPVFLFEETLADQQDELTVARGQIALSLVDLYRALGGGWEMRLGGQASASAPRPAETRPAGTTAPADTMQ